MVNTKNILALIHTFAPFDLAEDWDNSGLQAGNPDWAVKRVMIGLDVTLPLMTAAKEWNSDLVLTHHPLMIQPEKSIDFGRLPGAAIQMAAAHHISIVSAHTNLDKADQGLNDYFADRIGLENLQALVPQGESSTLVHETTGMGRIGRLASPMVLGQVGRHIKRALNLPYIRLTGNMDLMVSTLAICTGSGGSLIDEFLDSGADAYVTGDMKYHEARQIEDHSKGLVDVGHFGSEHMAVDLLADQLIRAAQIAGLAIEVKKFTQEKDPFTIV